MNKLLTTDWNDFLKEEFEKPYFRNLMQFIDEEYSSCTIFPPMKSVFRAFECCSLADIKVVIIGQDPYHGAGQADGLSFSVPRGVQIPPSLRNIFKEVAACGYTQMPCDGDLERWARQGVLLLNSVLTVREKQPGSHANRGWETFTNAVISKIETSRTGIVYMLWGSYAHQKMQFIPHNPQSLDCVDQGRFETNNSNLILTSSHPSPLSVYRGFSGCRHFTKANEYLCTPIVW